ncbi:hypothetical protein ACL9RL_08780 [Plantibacter sp. Mn2098]|uniref:hypothetical protein n=1 Tax=Plantibacter sp. Mn2098 TaxID=3395266 RepID=UPI003BEBDC36
MQVAWSAESVEVLEEAELFALSADRRYIDVADVVSALHSPRPGRAAAFLVELGMRSIVREASDRLVPRSAVPLPRSDALGTLMHGAWLASNAAALPHTTTVHLLGCAMSSPTAHGPTIDAIRAVWTPTLWEELRRESRVPETTLAALSERWRFDVRIRPRRSPNRVIGPESFERTGE